MRLRRISFVLAVVSIFAFASFASADILAPGASGPPDILGPSGTLRASLSGTWTNTTSTMSGTYVTAVYSDPLNTFGAGDLDFVYQVFNNANSIDSVGRTTAINFTGWLTDVGFTLTGSTLGAGFVNGTVIPISVDRSLSGDSIGFSFTPPILAAINPGQTSMVLVIETNATLFTAGNFNLIDGGVTTVAAFEPLAARVPEGSALSMLGISGFALLGAMKRKFVS
jgi:hypothetical protein